MTSCLLPNSTYGRFDSNSREKPNKIGVVSYVHTKPYIQLIWCKFLQDTHLHAQKAHSKLRQQKTVAVCCHFKVTRVATPAPPPAAPPAAAPPERFWIWALRVMLAVVRVVFSASEVAILVARVLLLACKFPTVWWRAFSWPTSCWSWASTAGLATSLSSSKQVCPVKTHGCWCLVDLEVTINKSSGRYLGWLGQACWFSWG